MKCSICDNEKLLEIGIRNFVPDDFFETNSLIELHDFKCVSCGHLQSKNFGGSDFLNSLYINEKLEEKWDLNGLKPYAEIARMAVDFSSKINRKIKIVYDFGAGDLEVLSEGFNFGIWEKENTLGIDFNINKNKNNIPVAAVDLSGNFAFDLMKKTKEIKFDLGFCTHVLEHLEDPKNFLKEVLKLSHSNSILYVEVPDNLHIKNSDIVNANLYGIQHIHFYTLQTLIKLVNKSGWEVLSANSSRFGWVPRLCLFLQPSSSERVVHSYQQYNHNRDGRVLNFMQKIIEASNSGNNVAIWGIGSDFHIHMNKNNSLLKHLSNNVILIDKRFEGRNLCNYTIKSTNALVGFKGKIFCTPLTENSRSTMMEIAVNNFPDADLIFPE